jgi:hypothetical protein
VEVVKNGNDLHYIISQLEELSRKGCIGCTLLCQAWSLYKADIGDVSESNLVIYANRGLLWAFNNRLHFYNLKGELPSMLQ